MRLNNFMNRWFASVALVIVLVIVAGVVGWRILSNKPVAEPASPITNISTLSASPTSGGAPLTVTLTSIFGDPDSQPASWSDGIDTNLDFGDNTKSAWMQCPGSDAERQKIIESQAQQLEKADFIWFRCTVQVRHTYYKAGTYIARLYRSGGFCPAPGCGTTDLGTAIITVK